MSGTPPPNILLVEDDQLLREAFTEMVRLSGYPCTGVSNGREALALLADSDPPFDLVLLDMVLEDMGGELLFPQMRALYPAIRVILLTGRSQQEFAEILAQPGTAYSQKPCTIAALSAAIDGLMQT